MSKIEKLLDKTKRNSETKKWKMYVFAVVGILIIVGGFFGGLLLFDPIINEYAKYNKDAPAIYDFYDLKLGENDTTVFAIGSSVIGRAFYAPTINEILKERGYKITAYNAYYSSDSPIERSLEIQKIIDAKPALVLYGLSYGSLTTKIESTRLAERTKLVFDRLNIRDDALTLFTDEEREIIETPPTIDYKKTFLKSAIMYKLFGKSNTAWTLDHLTDPYGEKARIAMDYGKLSDEEIIKGMKSYSNVNILNESSRYTDAFIYNVKTLQDAGIPVVILNMPIHPLLSDKVTDESRQNYFNLLNQSGCNWYDYEQYYNSDYFVDTQHVTFAGAKEFAPVFADIIIQEMT